MTAKNLHSGFTLIEIAIVLLVVTIILGYTVAMFPIQQELRQYRQANREMDSIIDHLIAFAQVNGRLPCPDTNQDGIEDTIANGCGAYFALLPRATLGMRGDIDANGNLLDPWGGLYLYHVSDVDTGSGNVDLVVGGDIRIEGLTNVIASLGPPPAPGIGGLVVCDDSPTLAANETACEAGTTTLINNAAAVIVSQGKDIGLVASNIQAENNDDFNDGTNDLIYTFTTRSDVAGSEFDDIVKWISPSLLFSKMIEAEQLP